MVNWKFLMLIVNLGKQLQKKSLGISGPEQLRLLVQKMMLVRFLIMKAVSACRTQLFFQIFEKIAFRPVKNTLARC